MFAWLRPVADLMVPPLALLLLALAAAGLAWRQGARLAAAVIGACLLGVLFLATPLGAGLLITALDRELSAAPAPRAPGAIIVLSAEAVRDASRGPTVGPLTLERLRAGAALHRRTGLPLLLTGGPIAPEPGAPTHATLMAESLAEDFRLEARWLEPLAVNTRDNAARAVAILRAEGIAEAFVVTHAWHLPRTLESFEREGFTAIPAPVRLQPLPDPRRASDWRPRPDHLAASWLALREWIGRAVYRFEG